MTERVLVPYDGSEQSRQALDYALEQFPGARITVLHVIDPLDAGYSPRATMPGGSEEWYEHAKDAADELFEEAQERADDYDVDLDVAREIGRPARVIIDHVEDHDATQVVMGSHGRSGVTRILLGSVAETVVRRSPVPVTVVR
ncbi:universal stress protein [Halobacteriaceae archaeon GCM10025711]